MAAGIFVVDGSLLLPIDVTKQRSFLQPHLVYGFVHSAQSNALSKIYAATPNPPFTFLCFNAMSGLLTYTFT
jgi:hypothetical protein